jgi:hypothetical protein
MNLNKFFDFYVEPNHQEEVLYHKWTFSKHIQFTIIYLLKRQKLNQIINLSRK